MQRDKHSSSTQASRETASVRGESLSSLIATATFVEVLFLLWRGDHPREQERHAMEAMLVAVCDHGVDTPSTAAVRVAVSTGNALHTALASGFLAMGPKHGCAVTPAMEVLCSPLAPAVFVRKAIAAGRRIPGYGHKIYTVHDPRTAALLVRAKELGYYGKYVERACAIERALAEAKGRRFVLNVDGMLAALLLELHFPPEVGNAVFMLGRLPGLIAHAHEASSISSYLRRAPHEAS